MSETLTPKDRYGNLIMQGERCSYCSAENVLGFTSPAFGPSHFCGDCGMCVYGRGFSPSALVAALPSPDGAA